MVSEVSSEATDSEQKEPTCTSSVIFEMDSFFSRLFRQTSFHRESERTIAAFDDSDDLNFSKEDEGYIIVGKTHSERDTQTQHSTCKITSNGLPSYDQAIKRECTMQQSPSVFNTMPKPVSPVSDIPFKFHPTLDAEQYIRDLFQGVDLQIQQFNWGKYSHDFTNEKLCLRDLSCGEEVNIDEFVFSQAERESDSLDSRDGVRDLIDL